MNLPHGPRGLELAYCWGAPEAYSQGKGYTETDPVIALQQYCNKVKNSSILYCQMCNRPYIIHGSYKNTEYCLECSGVRSTYAGQRPKDERRFRCRCCNKMFTRTTPVKTCSDDCAKKYRIMQHKKYIINSRKPLKINIEPVARIKRKEYSDED